MIRDQIMLYRNYTLLYHNRCSSCSKTTHLTSDCPIINAQFNPKLIISRENFPIFNKRSQHLRRANRNHCFTIPNVEIELDFNKKQVSTFESKNIEEIDEEVEKIEEKKELFYNFNEFSEIESNKTDQMSLPLLKQDSPLLKQNSPFLKHDPPLMNPFIPLSKLNSPLLKQNSPLLKQNSPFLKQNSPLLKQNSPHLKKKDLKLTVKLTEIEKQLEKLSDSITNPKIAFETEEINVSFGTKKNAIVEPSPINKLNKSAFQSWKIKNMNSLNSLNSSKIIESVIEKNENSLEKNENIIFSQFEKMHTFEKYFHNGNYVNVLLKIQKTMNTTSRTKKKKEESFLPILKAKLGTQRLKTNFKMLKSQKKRRSPTESLKRRLSKFKF